MDRAGAGRPSPARMRVRVVLPAPLRPTSPTLSPGPTRKETSCISNRAPARTSSLWALIIRLVSLGRPGPRPDGGVDPCASTRRPGWTPAGCATTPVGRRWHGRRPGRAGTRIPLPGGAKAGGGLGIVLIIAVILLLKVFGGIDLTGVGAHGRVRHQPLHRQLRGVRELPDRPGRQRPPRHVWPGGGRELPQRLLGAGDRAAGAACPVAPETAVDTFSGQTSTGCGQASSATGPFYCPSDSTIYFDPTFFKKILQEQLNGPSGAFVQPYVVGPRVRPPHPERPRHDEQGEDPAGAEQRLGAAGAAGRLLRRDVGAQRHDDPRLPGQRADPGPHPAGRDEAIAAAKSVGDDTIQKETGNPVDSEHWTHGSSAARVHWFTDRLPERHARRLQHLQRPAGRVTPVAHRLTASASIWPNCR